MFARVTSGELSPDDIDKFAGMIRDQVIPRAQALDGFKGGYWLADHENGRVLGITMFESEAALRSSQGQAARIRDEASEKAGLPTPTFSTYEVIASVGSGVAAEAA